MAGISQCSRTHRCHGRCRAHRAPRPHRGHAAVAVDAGDHWVLHVGDAFYDRAQIDDHGRAPRSLLAMERLVAADWSRVRANHVQLQELWAHADPGLVLVNAHDPALLDRARAATLTANPPSPREHA